MTRRKLPESQLKKFRTIGIHENDYARILKEEKATNQGIANIITGALDQYLDQKRKAQK